MLSILHGLREVWWVIAVPFVVGIVLTTLRAVASQQAFENDTSIDAALDMTFLALGAVGGVLSRPKISQEMAGYLAEFIGAVLLIMGGIAAFLLYHRRFSAKISDGHAKANLLLGVFACSLVAVVAYLGA